MRFLLGGNRSDFVGTKRGRELVNIVEKTESEIFYTSDFDELRKLPLLGFDENTLQYCAALRDNTSNENTKSVVARVCMSSFSCLLTGDATGTTRQLCI